MIAESLIPMVIGSRLGVGCMRFTGSGIWGPPPDSKTAIATLRSAVDAGVQVFDTADAYGPGHSEELLREAFGSGIRELMVATKGGLVRASAYGPWQRDGSPASLTSACEASLKRLSMDSIPIYILHRVDPLIPIEESVGAISELATAGKVQRIGVSRVTADQLQRAKGVAPIAVVENELHLGVEDANVLDLCADSDCVYFAYSPLARGELARRPPPALAAVAKKHGRSCAQVAIAWLLAFDRVVPIPSPSDPHQLSDLVNAQDLTLDDDDLAVLALS